jgi:membrane fusion protein (multidrug efflux system)
VTIKVDAYPDYDFNGTVTSCNWFAFSILPPDNATGNFVKQFNVYP